MLTFVQKALKRKRLVAPTPNILIQMDVGSVTLKFYDGFQSRNESSGILLLKSLEVVRDSVTKPLKLPFFTTDFPPKPGRAGQIIAAYCKSSDQPNIICLPDFIFWAWPEVGIADYNSVTAEVIAAGNDEPLFDELFWIGNSETNPNRKRLIELSTQNKAIIAIDIRWDPEKIAERLPRSERMNIIGGTYVSLADHCHYRYLIDVEGAGYSGRLKILLFSRRVLFIQKRPYNEYFFPWLKEYEHYIPVRRDLSDLNEKLEWAKSNPEQCARIANNAFLFATRHLSRESALTYMRDTILSHAQTKKSKLAT